MITSSVEEIDRLLKEAEKAKDSNVGSGGTNTSDSDEQSIKSTRQNFYPGDLEDASATPIDKEGRETSSFQTLDFADPAELVNFFNEDISSGRATLHKWQNDTLEHLASVKPTSASPHKFALVAANGSGKDLFIVAPFAIWFTLTKVQSRVIVTSSSGTQLTAQTETYIRNLAESINKFFGCEIYRVRQRYIKCRLSGSEIRMFATDEAGKAEGYHPFTTSSEMAIIVNESKSVSEEIHGALRRCTGYNYWLEVSTPGAPNGFFYRAATTWPNVLRITSYDCPHLPVSELEADKLELGEHSALFRSKHLALFTSLDEDVVITEELLNKLLLNPPIQESFAGFKTRIGIDIAAGGDENVVCFTRGVKCIKEKAFRETDTTITADRIEQILIEANIPKDYEYIFADDGGVGHAVIDMLVRKGWRINRILNQWAAINKKQFGNRGAENWYRVKRIFEEGFFDVRTLSDTCRKQLINRHYKQTAQAGRIMLQSKKEAKAHGYPSPDRADALVLSLTGLVLKDFIDSQIAFNAPKINGMTMDQLAEFYRREVTFKNRSIEDSIKSGTQQRCYNSLREAMKN